MCNHANSNPSLGWIQSTQQTQRKLSPSHGHSLLRATCLPSVTALLPNQHWSELRKYTGFTAQVSSCRLFSFLIGWSANDVPKSVKDGTEQTRAALAPCTKYCQPISPWVCVKKKKTSAAWSPALPWSRGRNIVRLWTPVVPNKQLNKSKFILKVRFNWFH